MVKRLLAGIILLGVVLSIGCVGKQSNNLAQPIDSGTIQARTGGVVASVGEPPVNQTWISPAKVEIGKFYPGARAEWELQVHNGNDYETTFAVAYRQPDNVGDGYIKAPLVVRVWVDVADGLPIIAPKETRNILVALDMPKGAQTFGTDWEFWVSVSDKSQTGMVRVELCERVLVSMRE